MKKAYIPFAAVVIALVLTAPALADAPNLLNYQGRLTDPSGNPRNGTFTMQFAVYDAESGGNQLPSGAPWSETQSVTVTNGVFNVLLGSETALPTNLFEGGPSNASGPLRFLQVTVSGEVLSPRRRIVSAAYTIQTTASGGVPTGAIILWDQSITCPAGFTRVTEFDGEHLVGGPTPGMNQGQDFVTLTVNQMPPHSHNWGSSHHDGNPTNNPGVNNNDPQTNNDFFKVTTATGGGQPFDNRPAGRTILLCRKN